MTRKNIHTVFNKASSIWENKREGSSKPISQASKKDKAVTKGANAARAEKVEHVIHNMNNRIGSRNSYGNDPFPPRN